MTHIRTTRWFAILGIFLIAFLLMSEVAEARRSGGSRGGGSFGGSRRSYSQPRSAPRSFSSPRQRTSTPRQTQTVKPRTSFGGTRLSSGQAYRKSYGIPRRTEQVRVPNQAANSPGVTAHYYGGMGDRFMMGYMMGSTSWLWFTPFHPAFYYSRPHVVENSDGTREVYPPTFSWGTVFLVVLVVGGIAYIGYVIIRNRRKRTHQYSTSSFG
jgi:hypothetical protein